MSTRVVVRIIGAALAALGLVLLVLPGPGLLALVLGLVLLAVSWFVPERPD